MPTLHFMTHEANIPKQVRLFKKITTLGKDSTNDIPVPHDSVMQNHAYIAFDDKYYTISGVNKKTRIFVNGKKEKSTILKHRDVITLGDISATFDLFDEIKDSSEDDSQKEIANYKRLYEFTETLISNDNIEDLLNKLIDKVIEVTDADNGFLILKKDDQNFEFTVARNINRESIKNATAYVSDSIISRVIQGKTSIIVSDAQNDDVFANSKSVMDLKLSSVMCVPLIARGNLLGIIYVGNNNVINLFTPDKLQILEVFSAQASLVIHNALLLNELRLDRKELKSKIEKMRYGTMIGSSDAMREVFNKIEKISPIDVPVLIQGETGTGKELVAQEIHKKSQRKDGPFVVINCGAIPRELLESELFGHVKGAFTGAIANKPGKFKVANGGTLFLDEIGDMPLDLQVKLLRVLEEHKIVAVGDTTPEEVDIRVVAATNKPLAKASEEGSFREDLYYRLNVITIELPPLRERGEDLILIAKYFLSRYAKEYERKIKGLTQRAIEIINSHAWPGNVRELENRIKKAVIMAEKLMIEPEDLDLDPNALSPILPLAHAREEFQMNYIKEALRRNNNNRTKTAQVLDVDPRTIFRYLEKMSDG